MIFAVYRKDLQTGESKKIGSSDSNSVATEIMLADVRPRSANLMFAFHCISRDANKSVYTLDSEVDEQATGYEYTILTE